MKKYMILFFSFVLLITWQNKAFAETDEEGWSITVNGFETTQSVQPLLLGDSVFFPCETTLKMIGLDYQLENEILKISSEYYDKNMYVSLIGGQVFSDKDRYEFTLVDDLFYLEKSFFEKEAHSKITYDSLNREINFTTDYQPFLIALERMNVDYSDHIRTTDFKVTSTDSDSINYLIYHDDKICNEFGTYYSNGNLKIDSTTEKKDFEIDYYKNNLYLGCLIELEEEYGYFPGIKNLKDQTKFDQGLDVLNYVHEFSYYSILGLRERLFELVENPLVTVKIDQKGNHLLMTLTSSDDESLNLFSNSLRFGSGIETFEIEIDDKNQLIRFQYDNDFEMGKSSTQTHYKLAIKQESKKASPYISEVTRKAFELEQKENKIVHFKDDAFELFLRKQLGGFEGDISYHDLYFIQELNGEYNAPEKTISNIDEVQYMPNLKTLILPNQAITDMSPISKLIHLEDIDLSDNEIKEIPDLSAIQLLQTLTLPGNKIDKFDIAWEMNGLVTLDLRRNEITSLKRPDGNTKSHFYLRNLLLSDNKIVSLQELKDIDSLTTLYLNNNQIESLGNIEFNKLSLLFLGGNKITDIEPINNLSKLDTLNLSNNHISDMSMLNLPYLTELDISDNQLKIVGDIDLPELKYLWIDGNELAEVEDSIFKSGKIVGLDLSRNRLSDMHFIKQMKAINVLNVYYNRITENDFMTAYEEKSRELIIEKVQLNIHSESPKLEVEQTVLKHINHLISMIETYEGNQKEKALLYKDIYQFYPYFKVLDECFEHNNSTDEQYRIMDNYFEEGKMKLLRMQQILSSYVN